MRDAASGECQGRSKQAKQASLPPSFSDDRGVPEMSDAAAGDVAIDPKAPFTPGLAGLDRYCRRDAQWANLGLLFDDAFSNTASSPKKAPPVIVMPRWGF